MLSCIRVEILRMMGVTLMIDRLIFERLGERFCEKSIIFRQDDSSLRSFDDSFAFSAMAN